MPLQPHTPEWYDLTVLSDCCADGDAQVRRVLLTRVCPRQADVLTVAEWAAALEHSRARRASARREQGPDSALRRSDRARPLPF
jgi:hypothetical protein